VEFSIDNFDNKKYFITFKEEFASVLREYKNNDYKIEFAKKIFDSYGMFILERGIYGGYLKLRTVASRLDLLNQFLNESEESNCFEAAISSEANIYGFSSTSGNGEVVCDESPLAFMSNLRNSFMDEVQEVSFVGGTPIISDAGTQFQVTLGTSTLLTDKDMYPNGDSGIKLRFLTDFLTVEKISPVEMRRHQISETEFEEIQQNLKKHLIAELEDVQQVLGECSPCGGLIYIERDDNSDLICVCYNPTLETAVPTPTFSPTSAEP